MKKFVLILHVIFAAVLLLTTGSDAAMSGSDFVTLCGRASLAEIEKAIEAGANIKAVNDKKETALHSAVSSYRNNPAVVAFLIENGADVNAKDDKGVTPLMLAAQYRDQHFISMLLQAGANLEDNDGSSFAGTPLMYAARNGRNTGVISALIEAGANLKATNSYGRTALHIAAADNPAAEALKILLENGAELDGKDNQRRTPLMAAAKYGRPLNIVFLLNAGADAGIRDNSGANALHHAGTAYVREEHKNEWKAALERLMIASGVDPDEHKAEMESKRNPVRPVKPAKPVQPEAFLMLLIGLAFIAVSAHMHKKTRHNCTAQADAEVTGYETKTDTLFDERRVGTNTHLPVTMYYPVFKYTVKGVEYTASGKRGRGSMKWKEGARLPIQYNPQDPKEIAVPGDSGHNFVFIFCIGLAGFFCVAMFIGAICT